MDDHEKSDLDQHCSDFVELILNLHNQIIKYDKNGVFIPPDLIDNEQLTVIFTHEKAFSFYKLW